MDRRLKNEDKNLKRGIQEDKFLNLLVLVRVISGLSTILKLSVVYVDENIARTEGK